MIDLRKHEAELLAKATLYLGDDDAQILHRLFSLDVKLWRAPAAAILEQMAAFHRTRLAHTEEALRLVNGEEVGVA